MKLKVLNKKIHWPILALLLLVAGFTLLPTHKALAKTPVTIQSITWVDRATIKITIQGKTYTLKDGDIGDGTFKYENPSPSYICGGFNLTVSDIDSHPENVKLNDFQAIPGSGVTQTKDNCIDTTYSEPKAQDTANSKHIYLWKNQNTIVRADGNSDWTFQDSGKKNSNGQSIYLKNSETGDQCQDRILVSANNTSEQIWVLDKGGSDAHWQGSLSSDQQKMLGLSHGCNYLNSGANGGSDSGVTRPLGDLQARANPPSPPPTASGSDSDKPECGSDNTSMSWAICPIYNIIAEASDHFDNLINSLLHVNTAVFSSQQFGQAYYTAWASFRNIALIFIIIAAVVMVIAQATGSRAIDAYTVKRVMPRLLFAAIAITLSWIVLIFIINVSNVLGEGIQALIYGPFNSLSSTGGGNGLGGNITGVAELGILSLLGAVALILTGGGLLSFAIVAGIAIIVGLLIVVLRQILVTFLLIIAPLAIAAYVLPNTQKMSKEWWDMFIKALLMFPIITAMIAAGKVFSLVALNQSTSNPVFGIIAILAYILPYFLLPFTFKMAGSAMGTIAQGIHGFGKKAAGSNMMGALKERGKEKNKLGTRFGRGNRVTRGLSNFTQAGATTGQWAKGGPGGWKSNLRNVRETSERARSAELAAKDADLDALNGDTDVLQAGLAYGNHHNNDELRKQILATKYGGKSWDQLGTQEQKELRDDENRVKNLYRQHGEATQQAFLNKLSQDPNAFREKEVTDANGNTRTVSVTEQIGQAATDYGSGDMNKTTRAAMMMRANQARAGRGDVADASAGTWIKQLQAANANGGQFTDDMAQTIMTQGFISHDGVDQARQKPASVEAKVTAASKRIDKLTTSATGGKISIQEVLQRGDNDSTELKQLLDTMQSMYQGMGANYSSSEVSTKTNAAMDAILKNTGAREYYTQSAPSRGDNQTGDMTQRMLDEQARQAREDAERRE